MPPCPAPPDRPARSNDGRARPSNGPHGQPRGPMYAVIETGSKQYRVEVGTELQVELLDVEPGQTITLERVLLVADGDTAAIGRPIVDDAKVTAEVVRRERGVKTISFKYRPKARRRVKKGHRQELTVLRVEDIVLDGKSAAKEVRAAEAAARTERQRLEEAAARQAAEDKALAAKLAKAARPRRRRRTEAARPRVGREEGDDRGEAPPRQGRHKGQARPPRPTRPKPSRRRQAQRGRPEEGRPHEEGRVDTDGPQESRLELEERPRQRRPAARRQARRRPARHVRLDHRPPARDDLPVRHRDRARARLHGLRHDRRPRRFEHATEQEAHPRPAVEGAAPKATTATAVKARPAKAKAATPGCRGEGPRPPSPRRRSREGRHGQGEVHRSAHQPRRPRAVSQPTRRRHRPTPYRSTTGGPDPYGRRRRRSS